MPCILGVDFDNTIVSYDEVLYSEALGLGLITPDVDKNKKAVRNRIRQLPDGEIKWRKMQSFLYGKGMDRAVLFEGVRDFFRSCKNAGIPVYIVSHKTEFAQSCKDRISLREIAFAWMKNNGFFNGDGMGLSQDRVYFESTPEEKIDRIKRLGCTHFIDDLEELFLEESFPDHIEKILFTSSQEPSQSSKWKTLNNWQKINEYFVTCTHNELITKEVKIAEKLLDAPFIAFERIAEGSNGRVYRLKSKSGKQYVAKFYFHHDRDTRDRLETEFSSLSFLWGHGIQCVPQPIAINKNERCAIYKYIEGKKVLLKGVTTEDIDQVVHFLGQLKKFAEGSESRIFHPASEAYFSIQRIIENIEWRLGRLQKAALEEKPLSTFLEKDLKPFWAILMDWCKKRAAKSAISWDSDISVEERTLSPSDFGFHNALKEKGGHIVFIDFEYFGWDDPAKMISDFLLHPAMAFDEILKREFVRKMFNVFKKNKNFSQRVEIVYPLFGFKWCLIFLNEFIPDEMQRRNFAQGNLNDKTQRQKEQLSKAQKMLNFVKNVYQDFPYRI